MHISVTVRYENGQAICATWGEKKITPQKALLCLYDSMAQVVKYLRVQQSWRLKLKLT